MERENVLLFLTTVQIAATALYTAWKLRKNKRWRSRRWWVRPIMARREEHGDFATLFQELKEDPVLFFRYTRMNVPTFYELLHLISPHITKRSARPSISAQQRLAITVRENDSGVMSNSSFGQAFSENKLNLPQGYACLPGSNDVKTPCYFVGDAAFHDKKPNATFSWQALK
ncbi:hypothetical protein NQ314_008694 [Rhamnusium bicolor]|uniref:Uncharacterized protein n=1 Tax=Rhamnusium bicolor TaxID=1586634 RepID=A0AAV8Y9B7_9CUCU|nr:hypothetical protein NQ314_008694 [Rhamnusium bicolor]